MTRHKEREERKKQPKFTAMELEVAIILAKDLVKDSAGHLFDANKKNLCTFCGVDQKTETSCRFWFTTFLDRLKVLTVNPEYIRKVDKLMKNWDQEITAEMPEDMK